MYKNIVILVIFLFFSGCANRFVNSNTDIEKEQVSSRHYDNISKDDILNNIKKIFYITDSKFVVDSYRSKVISTRVNQYYRILDSILIIDIWEVSVTQDKNGAIVTLRATRQYGEDEENKQTLSSKEHNIFWERFEFLLGLTNSWKTCFSNDILCGFSRGDNILKSDIKKFKEKTFKKKKNKINIKNIISKKKNDLKVIQKVDKSINDTNASKNKKIISEAFDFSNDINITKNEKIDETVFEFGDNNNSLQIEK